MKKALTKTKQIILGFVPIFLLWVIGFLIAADPFCWFLNNSFLNSIWYELYIIACSIPFVVSSGLILISYFSKRYGYKYLYYSALIVVCVPMVIPATEFLMFDHTSVFMWLISFPVAMILYPYALAYEVIDNLLLPAEYVIAIMAVLVVISAIVYKKTKNLEFPQATMTDLITHYDKLIDENNDPYNESRMMQEYMNKWDGDTFIDALSADKSKNALEIGMGTGRLTGRIAPLFGSVAGIDISPKTIARAKENLSAHGNITYILGDFMTYDFVARFDIIYSSLTFMHIKDKEAAIEKIASLLSEGGRLVLSIDKNQSDIIDYGTREVKIYPDNPDSLTEYVLKFGMNVEDVKETEFAYIIIASKGR